MSCRRTSAAASEAWIPASSSAASSRRWDGLSGRYEREPAPDRGPRGQVRTTWDQLTDGEDPTLRDAPDQT